MTHERASLRGSTHLAILPPASRRPESETPRARTPRDPDLEACQRAHALALRLEKLHFIDPYGRELVGRLSALPAPTNHHVVCRWVMAEMPSLHLCDAMALDIYRLINRFAALMQRIAATGRA